MTERATGRYRRLSVPDELRGRAEEIEQAFIDSLQRGAPLDREVLLSSEPQLAGYLADHLAFLEALYEVGPPADLPRGEAPETGPPAPPDWIGPYRVADLLGWGGMGVVYLAKQEEPVSRTVAVKLLRLGPNGGDAIRRLEAEREALALMDHPGIARILDGGTLEDRSPYLVMEYVPGTPITRYCDEHRLSLERRLDLFLDVCEAVQHAHQKGVVHRDLKPSNILVAAADGRVAPKVIDFGIAKFLAETFPDRTTATEDGRLLGTLEYMSPEQAGGRMDRIDTRTDIYSLGVILHELLAGSLPFEAGGRGGTALLDLRRRILTGEPRRPSESLRPHAEASDEIAGRRDTGRVDLVRSLRGDLDWIILKALEKDLDRRYATVRELAADILRHRRDEPVLASPPSRAYQLQKLWRRHRAAFLAGTAIAVGLLLGLLAVVILYVEADRARGHAEEARKALERERDVAALHARRAIATSEALHRVLASANPLRNGGGVTLKDLLDRSAPGIAEAASGEPLVEASLRSTVGASYLGLGLHEAAAPHLERALAIRRQILGETHTETIRSRVLWAHILHQRGEFEEAISVYRDAAREQAVRLGADNPETLSTRHDLATVLQSRGDLQGAAALFRDVLDARRLTLGEDHEVTLQTLDNLAFALQSLGRLDEAEGIYREAVARWEKGQEEDHPVRLHVLGNLANLLGKRGRWNEATRLQERVVKTGRRVLGDDHPWTLEWISSLGGMAADMGDLSRAESLLREVLDGFLRTIGENHVSTLSAMINLATILRARGRPEEAEGLLRRALKGQRVLLGPDHPTTLTALAHLGLLLVELGRIDEAAPLLEEALAARRRTLGQEHPRTLASIRHLGHLHQARGEWEDARQLYQRAYVGLRATQGESHPETLGCAHDLGEALVRTGEGEAAETLLLRCLQGRREVLGRRHGDTLATANSLATLLAERGERLRARSLYEESIRDGEKGPLEGSAMLHLLSAKHNLGSLLVLLGALPEAEGMLSEAFAGRRKLLGEDHPDTVQSLASLAVLFMDRRDFERASKAFRQLVAAPQSSLARWPGQRPYHQTCLGRCLVGLDRLAEAERPLRVGIEGLVKSFPEDHPAVVEAVRSLIRVLEARGAHEEADRWRKRLPPAGGEPAKSPP